MQKKNKKTRNVSDGARMARQPTAIGTGCNSNEKQCENFFSMNRQLSCNILHIKIRRIKFKLVLKVLG